MVDIKIHAETKRKKKKSWFGLLFIKQSHIANSTKNLHIDIDPFFSSFIIDVFNSFLFLVHLLLLVVFNYCLSKGVNYVVFFSSFD